MNLRTALLAFAAIGLFATAFAPSAGADSTEVPPDYPGACYQVYFFVYEIGPVTVDASDSCWQVIVEHEEDCEADELADRPQEADDCRQALEDALDEECDAVHPIFECAIETHPCHYIERSCDVYCTCDPIRPNPVR